MAQEEFYIGMDLCADYTQLSYYDEDKKEPESIYQLNTKDTYLLPNVIFYSEEAECWYIGAEASKHRFKEDGILVENIVARVGNNETIVIGGKDLTYKDLFLLMLKGHIEEFLGRFEDASIKKLVITTFEYNKALYEALNCLADDLELYEEQYEITSHANSYIHYIFNQPENLRNNSVVIFDYSVDGLDFYRMDINRKTSPMIIDVVHKAYKTQMPYAMVFGDRQVLDETFSRIAKDALSETYVSAIFLTGVGFLESWLKKSTAVLCAGRRVFMGQNIYAKGACYAAYSGDAAIEPDKYTIRTEDSVLIDIGVMRGDNGTNVIPIAYGGNEWYKMKGKISVFLDDTNRIELLYKNRITKEVNREIIEIHGLPKRPDKTTKLSLEVVMYSQSEGAVIIKDEGFGNLYPTTNKIYRKDFIIDKE